METIPTQLMGTLSAGVQQFTLLQVQCNRSQCGTKNGGCHDSQKYWARIRAGKINQVNDNWYQVLVLVMFWGLLRLEFVLLKLYGLAPLGNVSSSAVSSARIRVAKQSVTPAVNLAKHGTLP